MSPKSLLSIAFCVPAFVLNGADLNWIGVTFLRTNDPSLQGSGIAVAQVEAPVSANNFEVNPTAVGLPVSTFTWLSTSGSASTYPNAVGGESFHANEVGGNFYGAASGVAPAVAHVDSYEAGFFYSSRVVSLTASTNRVVNQSFIFTGPTATYDTRYDNYAAQYNTLFVSGVGNSGPPSAPATCYNGLGVAAYTGASSIGPTPDGRSKPDITAPASLTSFSTPQVAGVAAILLQAAARNDGGPGTAVRATNSIVIKALLMNGAEKPQDWTHPTTGPLDTRYGAGVVNLWNSYRQLRGGKQALNFSSSNGIGASHLPPDITNNLPTRRGWDYATLQNGPTQEAVSHYFVDLRDATNRTFTLKATLVWLRQQNQMGPVFINDLDLFLYDAVSNTLVASSQSLVDNVEHLYLTNLPPSRYCLQVLKNGGVKRITMGENYGFAFEFGPPEDARIINQSVASAQFDARVVGEPNQTYAVQRSLSFTSWPTLVTNRTSAQGFFDFSDTTNTSRRFYRTKLVP